VISRKAGEAVLRGAEVFVPGVLAASAGVEAGDLVAVSLALELPTVTQNGVAGGGARFAMTRGTVLPAGGGAAEEGSGGGGGRDGGGGAGALYIGVGRLLMGRTELFRVQQGVAVKMVKRVYDVPSVPGAGGVGGGRRGTLCGGGPAGPGRARLLGIRRRCGCEPGCVTQPPCCPATTLLGSLLAFTLVCSAKQISSHTTGHCNTAGPSPKHAHPQQATFAAASCSRTSPASPPPSR
jgi:hypothetical protein